jgi:uncharacterized protein YyaL (SSP411 family)
MIRLSVVVVGLWALSFSPRTEAAPAPAAEQIVWQKWSPEVFAEAKAQHRLVLLDLEAVWCHWCHVMDTTTYRDPAVVKLIQDHYIAVKVDQDSRPDLSNRYGEFGWPATIVFSADGSELAKRRGYFPPEGMASILAAFVEDPSPGPSVQPEDPVTAGAAPALGQAERALLEKSFQDNYDAKNGGWGFAYKSLDWYAVEYALSLAQRGDKGAAQMARGTLAGQLNLFDPVWGGVYQYSTDGDWAHPHFEKLMQFQAENLRIYALASALWPDEGYLPRARAIEKYVGDFLTSPNGLFYVSQDADLVPGQHSAGYFALNDAERRKQGLPRVDAHVYARENGWYIQALVTLSNVTGDDAVLKKAVHAAYGIQRTRAMPGGGFRHDADDAAGPYLGDTLAMGQAFLALYGATADREWMTRAEKAAQFIDGHFRSSAQGKAVAGYVTAVPKAGDILPSQPLIDENVEMARFANLLFHYTGDNRFKNMAQFAMSYLSSGQVVDKAGIWPAGLLLADGELNSAPLHVTVVGSKNDVNARLLFQAARALPGAYHQTEWLDAREGPLPHSDITYPELKSAAAFLCTDQACSSPITSPAALRAQALKSRTD